MPPLKLPGHLVEPIHISTRISKRDDATVDRGPCANWSVRPEGPIGAARSPIERIHPAVDVCHVQAAVCRCHWVPGAHPEFGGRVRNYECPFEFRAFELAPAK